MRDFRQEQFKLREHVERRYVMSSIPLQMAPNCLLDQWSFNARVDIAGQVKQWDDERAGSAAGNAPTPDRVKSK
jgi:hypothetical protein